jgi:hypothetical protein
VGSAVLTDTDHHDVKCCSKFVKAFGKTIFNRDVFLCGINERETDIPFLRV